MSAALAYDIVPDVQSHLGLVYREARRLNTSTRPGLELGDLIALGTLGLLEAVQTFDTSRGTAFSTHAIPRVRGAILDGIRACDPLSVPARAKWRAVQRARNILTAQLERAPTLVEVAAHLGTTPARADRWDARNVATKHAPIDEPALRDSIAGADDLPGEALNRAQEYTALSRAITQLTPKERVVIQWYYGRGWNGRVIAERLGISESAVSIRRTHALAKLRRALHRLR